MGKMLRTAIGLRVRFPSKLFGLITGIVAVVLILIALVSPVWLTAEGWRQGLFQHCIDENATTPLPFGVTDPPGCHPIVPHDYIRACLGLCIFSLLSGIIATLVTGIGLAIRDPIGKYDYYRVALYITNLSLTSLLLTLVIYPVGLISKLDEGNRTFWDVGWAYRFAWDAAGFLIASDFFLLFDEKSELFFYRAKYPESERVTSL